MKSWNFFKSVLSRCGKAFSLATDEKISAEQHSSAASTVAQTTFTGCSDVISAVLSPLSLNRHAGHRVRWRKVCAYKCALRQKYRNFKTRRREAFKRTECAPLIFPRPF